MRNKIIPIAKRILQQRLWKDELSKAFVSYQ
jgi:hypothetical protein